MAPSGVDRTVKDGTDLRALVDQEPAKILGRMSAGTLRVEKDGRGLLVEIDPPDTSSAHDIVASISRRDVSGMSFAFMTIHDDWDFKADPPVRTITDMLIREVSVVTFPAYPETHVALRTMAARRSGAPWSVDDRLRREAERARAWGAARRS